MDYEFYCFVCDEMLVPNDDDDPEYWTCPQCRMGYEISISENVIEQEPIGF